ncbi:NAD(P)-binding protein [Punctularia strigosozonata HHB-11173 SS5]|uniref:NAD(P)-binding protein n=1 Tax=Punctularia strigosozonata (strain HHB-11173) TaxID=741275 RepID=UPI0004418487|nr:NAD(P)-binding protein [Punctularia strigosozonata HHB-11173 SS5]EIN13468.1 NAD(P)-binding protein [Punctularia strigosozonata HHB-11173 SS5]
MQRATKLPAAYERVLIIGASSGIGRSIAHIYASRGARVCVVARREPDLQNVMEECRALSSRGGHSEFQAGGRRIIGVTADFTNVEDMVRVRTELETEWRGLDTLLVCAGVSALQPLLHVAGVHSIGLRAFDPPQATVEGIQGTVDVANAAIAGNFTGPLVSAVSLIPLLTTTSPSPSILLLSSLGAVVAPPTRSLYGSTKAASLMLYRSLSIEHPDIAFSFVLPATVEGDFRASAVDGGSIRESDPNKNGLKREYVAKSCVRALDESSGIVFLPSVYKWAQLLYWFFPSVVNHRARVKYNYPPIEAPKSASE